MNSHPAPFLHNPLSQCLHTVRPCELDGIGLGGWKLSGEGETCRSGQDGPSGQAPVEMKDWHSCESASRRSESWFLRKGSCEGGERGVGRSA